MDQTSTWFIWVTGTFWLVAENTFSDNYLVYDHQNSVDGGKNENIQDFWMNKKYF